MHFNIRTLFRLIVTFAIGIASSVAAAQTALPAGIVMIPAQPSSADTIFLKIPRGGCIQTYVGATYRNSTSNGKIRVEILINLPNCPSPIGPLTTMTVEIGRLPPGSYSFDVVERLVQPSEVLRDIAANVPFTVSDHRATKTAPAVRLNYSDHWWDANNSGAGLFIWQDARDQLLAAWFTYGADGKPVWYTIQSGNWVTPTRYEGKLVQTSRLANPIVGGTLEASGPTSLQFVGTATLDFSGDDGALAGVFTSKLDDAASAQTRSIRRFGK